MKKYWTSLDHLITAKQIEESEALKRVASEFQIRVSPTMQALMGESDKDPIRQQLIPSDREATILAKELFDPIGDQRFTPTEGVVHRYTDRALLKITQLCEVYCRFCFRKEMIGHKGESLSDDDLISAFRYFREHEEIWEVILTGGDPLILSNRRLESVLMALAEIPHIKVIRIHTRIPIMNPERINAELLRLFRNLLDKDIMVYIAIHANHANEFSQKAKEVIRQLRETGIVLISQSVLLRGVNDSIEALSHLMKTFVHNGIKPYYLHQMDLARGTSHFVVPEAEAIALLRELRRSYSGICVPHLIQEIPEGEGKKALY